MKPICPKCGQPVIYIASGEDKVYIVNAEEKHFITKTGRISTGYQEHNCTNGNSQRQPGR
jgi:hypothetical protein